MTSPTGGGSEHVSRYRALGEFDNLIRAAKEAKRALKELREEEAKLNAQSLADDQKIAASKQNRARAEQQSAQAAKSAVTDLNKNDTAGKAGESAGTAYTAGVGRGIQKSTRDNNFLAAATAGLVKAMTDAGDKSGLEFAKSSSRRIERENSTFSTAFSRVLRQMQDKAGVAGVDTGNRYIQGFASKIRDLNNILTVLGRDKLDLDVGIDDAIQSIKALEFELTQLAHETELPQVRIDTNRALNNLRAIQKLFKDEVAEEIIKDSARVRKELEQLDTLPSGRAFKFWALNALSDMTKVFEEAERGTSVFQRLRLAASAGGAGGAGGNFLRTFVSGFDDFSVSSSKLLQRLSRISGELYRMPGLIVVLVAALPALIAGMGALAGGAVGLASGLGAALGAIVAIPAAATAAISVVGALSSTFGGLAEVLKNARQARQQDLEAQEQQRLGTDKALTAQQKYNLALRDMGPATEKVTEAVVDFSEKWAQTQKVIGENFFKEVAGDTERLNQLLPIAEDFFGRAATAIGKVASEGIKMMTSGPWKADFKTIAKDNAIQVENLGMAGLGVADAFRNIVVAAGPFNTWLTRAIREGAEAFADWSASARANGTIADFLNETKESLQSLWQIFKNLGNVVNSFFQSTVDEGQRYLETLEDITGGWAEVAEAQEEANSPLRQWMVQIRPILSGLGALIADLARGIAGLATNQSNVQSMVDLLDSLRTDVLPSILRILQELNNSGIAVTVTKALGDMLDAIATFLESGATQALSVFVTVLASFFELVLNIASLPGISHVLGAVASGVAAIAAVSIVARFTGLFKLWDFVTWMSRNRGNLSGAFADAARGVAGLQPRGDTALPTNIPSAIGPIGSEVISTPRTITNTGNAAQNAAGKVTLFSRAVSGISGAGNLAKSALSNFTAFLGGPWGVAILAATAGIGLIINHFQKQKQEADDTRNAFIALKNAYDQLETGDTSGVLALADTDEKLSNIIRTASQFKVSLTDVSGALNGQDQALNRVNTQLDTQIALLEKQKRETPIINYGPIAKANSDLNANAIATNEAIEKAKEFKTQINETAAAQDAANASIERATNYTKTYEERLGGLTQEQVDSVVLIGEYEQKINLLSGALDTLASATATNEDRSRAYKDLIEYETKATVDANEATEEWNSALLTLSETAEVNGKSLSKKTREGLRNRDALQAAAEATRNLYLEDIAAGTPMDKALKRHQDRIKELKEEADKTFNNRKEVNKLIEAYGEVPDNLKTNILSDEKGFAAVFAELKKMSIMQTALKEGKSVAEAEKQWIRESGGLYQRYIPNNGDGYGAPGFATGGPVWGAGTRTSDSIRAWLSNGEFVQPADSVEHYGMPIMEAIRKKSLNKEIIQEALPPNGQAMYASGGSVHSGNCMSCQSGGHNFATGGFVRVPMVVNPRNTLIDNDWATSAGALGGASGGRGWQWQMKVLREAFPGLPLWSGYRPGSRTLSGNQSYHALGRAVDLPPRRDVAAWIRNNYGANTKELITPYNDLNIWNGKPHRYTGAVWNQHNFAGGNAHDHWAFRSGGLVDLMNMMNMSMPSSQDTSLPSTPRTLSPAASSVVNNSTDNTRTFGDVIINNPMPERAGDSVRDALYRTTLLY